MTDINEKYIKGPFKADFHGGYVFSGPSGDFMFAQIRGWGAISYEKDAEKIQDANLKFMVDALNEKASGALKKAEKELDAIYSALSAAGISHARCVEGLQQGLSVIETLRKENDQSRFRLAEGTSCLVGLEPDGGFPCRNCLPCMRKERDEARKRNDIPR